MSAADSFLRLPRAGYRVDVDGCPGSRQKETCRHTVSQAALVSVTSSCTSLPAGAWCIRETPGVPYA